jgi:restriction system protein
MRRYYRVMLGKGSVYADECKREGFIGADFGIDQDLTGKLPEEWRVFNKQFIPIYLQKYPNKAKVAAGLACGFLWTITKGIKQGDTVLSPNGQGSYYVGEVTSDYYYVPGQILPHRRKVSWYPNLISRDDMSDSLRHSAGSIGTVSNVTRYGDELQKLLEGKAPAQLISNDESIENPTVFGLEKHLEDFLVANWDQLELAKKYQIYEEDGEKVGQQYETDTGPIDILAVSKDGKELLVIELKKGRASDYVVGQTQRYMGYIKDQVAEKDQTVKGLIIAFEDDLKIKRALSVAQNIEFCTYKVHFSLSNK